jgi:hypothetical protein
MLLHFFENRIRGTFLAVSWLPSQWVATLHKCSAHTSVQQVGGNGDEHMEERACWEDTAGHRRLAQDLSLKLYFWLTDWTQG